MPTQICGPALRRLPSTCGPPAAPEFDASRCGCSPEPSGRRCRPELLLPFNPDHSPHWRLQFVNFPNINEKFEGFTPNYSVFSWLVDGFYKKNTTDVVLLLPDELMKRGLPPDKSVYRSLIQRLCKKGLVGLSGKVLHQMQGKGLEADCLVYATLAYAQLTAGMLAAAMDTLNEMAKKQMSVTPQIYNCMCTSYGDEKETLNMFWVHAIERGLIGKSVYKLMQQVRLKSSKAEKDINRVRKIVSGQ